MQLPDIDVPLAQWTDEDWQAWAALMLSEVEKNPVPVETVS